MNRIPLFLCLFSLAASAQGPAAPSSPVQEEPPSRPAEDPCLAGEEDEADSEVLGALRLSINGENRALAEVKLEGLQRLPEPLVRGLARVPAKGSLTPSMRRSSSSGSCARGCSRR